MGKKTNTSPRPVLKPVPTLWERVETAASSAAGTMSSKAASAYSTATHYAATCCPKVSTFSKSATRGNYSGFDDKTNLVQTVGVDEYWIPPTKSKSLPSNKETRDGANWVSVGVGKTIEVIVSFAAYSGVGCLGNCTYKVDNTAIAEVVTTNITANKSSFGIRGKAAGECSVEVICTGKTRGYIHIWCADVATIIVDVGTVLSTKTRVATYSAAAIQTAMNNIYRQACIEIIVKDIGTIDVTKDAAFARLESAAYTTMTSITPSGTTTSSQFAVSQSILLALNAAITRVKAPASAYSMYYYVPSSAIPNAGGSVINIGSTPGFVFFDGGAASYNSMAHELGHSLYLRHPSDPGNTGQFAPHLLTGLSQNIMPSDPLNLMGYNPNKPVRTPLRYHQWKTCSRS